MIEYLFIVAIFIILLQEDSENAVKKKQKQKKTQQYKQTNNFSWGYVLVAIFVLVLIIISVSIYRRYQNKRKLSAPFVPAKRIRNHLPPIAIQDLPKLISIPDALPTMKPPAKIKRTTKQPLRRKTTPIQLDDSPPLIETIRDIHIPKQYSAHHYLQAPLIERAKPIYFEGQEQARCGLHALNNAMGEKMFTREDLANVATDIVNDNPNVVSHSELELPSGWYHISVLEEVLKSKGYLMERLSDTDPNILDHFIGVIICKGGHYMALRKNEDEFILLDSMKNGATQITALDVEMYLSYNAYGITPHIG